MKLNNKMSSVIADLEQLIGSECYNPNSYDGWNDVDGCEFRYPISIRKKSGEFVKIRGNINTSALINKDDITLDSVKYMKYRFGSNELFIGLGLINVLEYLEDRYDLNFNDLEQQRNEK